MLVVIYVREGVTDVERGQVEKVQLENWFGSARILRAVAPSWKNMTTLRQGILEGIRWTEDGKRILKMKDSGRNDSLFRIALLGLDDRNTCHIQKLYTFSID
jgi:hypothetical protein